MYLEGYINIDNKSMYEGDMKVDREADILDLEWEEDSVDEILVVHFFMYIQRKDAIKYLKRWHSWLNPTGRIIIESGNVLSIARNLLNAETVEELEGDYGIKQLYGWDTTTGHKWAWCPKTMEHAMKAAGFKNITSVAGGYHQNLDRDFTTYGSKQ